MFRLQSSGPTDVSAGNSFTGVFMLDIIFIAVTLGFFAVGILYTYACGKL